MAERRSETQLSNLINDDEIELAVKQWITESRVKASGMGRFIMRKLIREAYLPSLDPQGNPPDDLSALSLVEESFAIDIMTVADWDFDIFSSSLRIASTLTKQKLAQKPKSPPPREADTLGKIGGTDSISWENDWSRCGRSS